MRQPKRRPAWTPAAAAALAAALLATAPLQGTSDRAGAGEIEIGKDGSMIKRTDSKASASASASASAKATAGAARGAGCRASSSSSAEARAGDEIAVDRDEDFASSDDGACSAHAESRASATGQRKSD